VPDLAAARLTVGALVVAALLAALAPAAQAQTAYTIPLDNPFVGTPGARGEVYAYGLRNPFRWSFDRLTGDMYVGDVGGSNEEVTRVSRVSQPGANLGWNCYSGTAHVHPCDPPNYIGPVFDFTSSADVVIGGYVVRDPALPAFAGRYIYARFNTGVRIRQAGALPPEASTSLDLNSISGFGEDGMGHLYVTSLAGSVHRLVQTGDALDKVSVGNFDQPLAVAAPPGDPDRLFIVEKPGRVRNRDGSEFLDLTALVRDSGFEEGLLAFAVAPDYATSGRIYAFYNDNNGDLQVDEYTRTAPDRSAVSTRRPIITITHNQADNHNGGQMLFGPDGYLYLSTGDGGTQEDPEGDAQSLGSLLGKIIRIDVDPAPGAPAPPPAAPIRDTRAPRLRARVPRRQQVLKLRGAIAYAGCNERCTVTARGVLRFGKRRLRMIRVRRVARASQQGRRTRLKVRLKRKQVRTLRRSLRRGRRASVRLTLRASDAAGNRSRPARYTVRVRRR
jgi:glucose/arabinose dehydrogenase